MEKCANLRETSNGKGICGATEYLACNEKCPFYITVEAARVSLERSNARLNALSSSEQLGISEKYYDGKMPWKNN